ncbi:MAG: acyltransferase family protein, partial [Chloroflexi bacterium]|nr:acyltransferase family protein [Chloroflexota bacterium]
MVARSVRLHTGTALGKRDRMLTPRPFHDKSSDSDSRRRARLDYLDGIRGLAALFVVFHHVWRQSFHAAAPEIPPWWLAFASTLSAGHYGVAVFIVLSGFCLMLPVAKSADGRIPGGVAAYLKRRSRRILPPYYAALAFSLAALAIIPGLRVDNGTVESLYHPG